MESLRPTLLTPLVEYDSLWNTYAQLYCTLSWNTLVYGTPMLNLNDPQVNMLVAEYRCSSSLNPILEDTYGARKHSCGIRMEHFGIRMEHGLWNTYGIFAEYSWNDHIE